MSILQRSFAHSGSLN